MTDAEREEFDRKRVEEIVVRVRRERGVLGRDLSALDESLVRALARAILATAPCTCIPQGPNCWSHAGCQVHAPRR